MKKYSIGGQALIEGVMMKGPSKIAMAVRKPDGEIIIEEKESKSIGKWAKVPIIRGVVAFVSSMVTGVQALMFSAKFFDIEDDEDTKQNSKKKTANLNDNVETVLLNLLRGTGVSGLKGIEIKRIENDIEYIRPIRECERKEIEEYCEKQKLNPKVDKTNLESIYNRNKVRNDLIPYLKREFNPNILEGINRLSDIAREEEEYFDEIIAKQYEELKIGENLNEVILDLNKFNNLNKVIKSRLIIYTINKVNGNVQGIGKIHIEDIIKLCDNNIGNKYLTPNKNVKVFIKKGKIFFTGKIELP